MDLSPQPPNTTPESRGRRGSAGGGGAQSRTPSTRLPSRLSLSPSRLPPHMPVLLPPLLPPARPTETQVPRQSPRLPEPRGGVGKERSKQGKDRRAGRQAAGAGAGLSPGGPGLLIWGPAASALTGWVPWSRPHSTCKTHFLTLRTRQVSPAPRGS